MPAQRDGVNAAGIVFSGYLSLLAPLAGQPESSVFLMLAGADMSIVHVTLHEQLSSAVRRLGTDLVARATRATHSALHVLDIPYLNAR